MAKFVSIVSLKPNIGNTTVALNLGLALHNMGKRVVVIDTDFSKLNMLEHLYMQDVPVDLGAVLDNEAHIRDSIVRHASGLKIIPSRMKKSSYDTLEFQLPELASNNDFIILDAPKNLNELNEVLKHSDEAFIVHSPEYSSKIVDDARKILSKNKTVNLGIILNKAHDLSVNSIFKIPVITKIPSSRHVVESFQKKHPLIYLYPNSLVSERFAGLAKRIV
ncbi:MAG: MinD/ParA family ATP-binding protein [Candidatus Woesearchaeota archaeon]